jgi:hypothetical protein
MTKLSIQTLLAAKTLYPSANHSPKHSPGPVKNFVSAKEME